MNKANLFMIGQRRIKSKESKLHTPPFMLCVRWQLFLTHTHIKKRNTRLNECVDYV